MAGLVAREHVGVAQGLSQTTRWLQPPAARLSLIINLADPVHTQARTLPEDWVGGMSDTVEVIEMPGGHASLDCKLAPLGAYTILGLPLHELGGACVSLEDLFGPDGRRLGEQVREAADWPHRFALVDSFLVDRAAAGPRPTPAIAHAWSRLEDTGGRISIGDLAAAVGCSRRYLAARFRTEIGLTPKTAARRLRFAEVQRRLTAQPGRFGEIAQDCGYCDQSHLNRDFRELAGTTPGEFVGRRRPGQVPFIQDEGASEA